MEINNENNKQVEIIGVKFDDNVQSFYYKTNNEKFVKNEKIIAETERGLELGKISFGNFLIDRSKIASPLNHIVRKATKEDLDKYEELKEKSKEAKNVCEKLAQKFNLDMKLINAECLIDDSKIIFNFTSDGRVDFRELVKELANTYRTRIEMRQIGVRDETKIVGCFGICGQECCCSRFLNDYGKVSVKMAKNQNLSLNPQKISGVCGRLLCCLGYENEHYVETLKKMPQVGSEVETPDGKGIVTYNNLLKKIVSARVKVDEENFEVKQYNVEDIKFKSKGNFNNNDNKETKIDD